MVAELLLLLLFAALEGCREKDAADGASEASTRADGLRMETAEGAALSAAAKLSSRARRGVRPPPPPPPTTAGIAMEAEAEADMLLEA